MKKIIVLFAAISAMMAFTALPDELSIGSAIPSPELKMKDVSGKQFSFNDVKKKNGLLVVFSCNTCPWVIKNQQVASEGFAYAASRDWRDCAQFK
jgi:hypothetical protein